MVIQSSRMFYLNFQSIIGTGFVVERALQNDSAGVSIDGERDVIVRISTRNQTILQRRLRVYVIRRHHRDQRAHLRVFSGKLIAVQKF